MQVACVMGGHPRTQLTYTSARGLGMDKGGRGSRYLGMKSGARRWRGFVVILWGFCM